ncbi:uncharacterized protein RJT21DRAFT_118551 [Scheffersomyces amazonensis]|uniref:uncharacterized protein n=1 Tax=Scheffersomyces amazonensis TaxID=1078765 RepID=UPI00315DAE1B
MTEEHTETDKTLSYSEASTNVDTVVKQEESSVRPLQDDQSQSQAQSQAQAQPQVQAQAQAQPQIHSQPQIAPISATSPRRDSTNNSIPSQVPFTNSSRSYSNGITTESSTSNSNYFSQSQAPLPSFSQLHPQQDLLNNQIYYKQSQVAKPILGPPMYSTIKSPNYRKPNNMIKKPTINMESPIGKPFKVTDDVILSSRPFKCTFEGCSWAFQRRSDLRRHAKSHAEPMFVCPYWKIDQSCHRNGGSFNRLDVLKRHLRLVHYIKDTRKQETQIAYSTNPKDDPGWCRLCQRMFPNSKIFIDHCVDCSKYIENKRNEQLKAKNDESTTDNTEPIENENENENENDNELTENSNFYDFDNKSSATNTINQVNTNQETK